MSHYVELTSSLSDAKLFCDWVRSLTFFNRCRIHNICNKPGTSVDYLILWRRTFSRLSPQSGNLQKMWNSQFNQHTFSSQLHSLTEKISSDSNRSLEIFNNCGIHNIGNQPLVDSLILQLRTFSGLSPQSGNFEKVWIPNICNQPENNQPSKFLVRFLSHKWIETNSYLKLTPSFSDEEHFADWVRSMEFFKRFGINNICNQPGNNLTSKFLVSC